MFVRLFMLSSIVKYLLAVFEEVERPGPDRDSPYANQTLPHTN